MRYNVDIGISKNVSYKTRDCDNMDLFYTSLTSYYLVSNCQVLVVLTSSPLHVRCWLSFDLYNMCTWLKSVYYQRKIGPESLMVVQDRGRKLPGYCDYMSPQLTTRYEH
jgi:hypothetical protein